jgi:hypothetical protein
MNQAVNQDMRDTGSAPAADDRPVTLQEVWREACALADAADMARVRSENVALALDAAFAFEQAAEARRIAVGHARRARVFEKICDLIDLVLTDPDTLARLKDRAKEKREAAERAAAEAAADTESEIAS